MSEDTTESERLPDDIKVFLRQITLDLQQHRSKTEDEIDRMFQRAYKLYVKYKVDREYYGKSERG